MGLRLTTLKRESSGPRLFFGFFFFGASGRGPSSKTSFRASSSSIERRYSMRMMHQMPPVRILVYSRTYSAGITNGSISRLANCAT